MDMIAQLLLESRTGAYIEWLANELILLIKYIHKDSLLVMFFLQKGNPANHKAYHILWSQEIIPTSRVNLASISCTQGLFTPVAGAA